MIKAILFDMDGTLVDSEPFYNQRKQSYFFTRGIDFDEALRKQSIGRNIRDIFNELFDQDKVSTYYDDYCKYIQNHPAPYKALLFPDVLETLYQCKEMGYKLALVSSSPWENIIPMLEQCELTSTFDVVISGSDYPKAKPNPKVYEEAMGFLGLCAKQCIIVEDSLVGIQAGKGAGCYVIARRANDIVEEQKLQADDVLDDLAMLLQCLRKDQFKQ